jgi:hypothetical protein
LEHATCPTRIKKAAMFNVIGGLAGVVAVGTSVVDSLHPTAQAFLCLTPKDSYGLQRTALPDVIDGNVVCPYGTSPDWKTLPGRSSLRNALNKANHPIEKVTAVAGNLPAPAWWGVLSALGFCLGAGGDGLRNLMVRLHLHKKPNP